MADKYKKVYVKIQTRNPDGFPPGGKRASSRRIDRKSVRIGKCKESILKEDGKGIERYFPPGGKMKNKGLDEKEVEKTEGNSARRKIFSLDKEKCLNKKSFNV